MNWLDDVLNSARTQDLLRLPVTLHPEGPTHARLGERSVVVFCSNDYLGLRFDPRLITAATHAINHLGTGSGASRLISGNTPLHEQAERALADLVQQPSVLLTSSGFATNVGALASLIGPDDVVFSDALNHASIIDGCRLTRARIAVYPHTDIDTLKQQIRRHRPFRRGWIVTESLFSMDGDIAPLADLRAICDRESLHLYVDDAHAIGILGDRGQGAVAQANVFTDVLVGTLGKALGSTGALIAGTETLRLFLWNRCRSFVFSTGLPPAAVAAAGEAARIVREDPSLRRRLHTNIKHLRTALEHANIPIGGDSHTPIIPIVIGDERQALALSQRLLEDGFFVQAIRPPTVPATTTRLRITVSAAHTTDQIDALAASLARRI